VNKLYVETTQCVSFFKHLTLNMTGSVPQGFPTGCSIHGEQQSSPATGAGSQWCGSHPLQKVVDIFAA